MNQSIFYLLAFVTLFFAALVVFAKNPIHSALYMVMTFFAITCHYILLNAQFLAVVNFIVYMGAIMVLILFAIMFLNLNKDSEPHKSNIIKFAGVIAAGLLMMTLFAALKKTEGANEVTQLGDSSIGLVKNLGKVLFKDFLLPFEIISILLLSAMVGSVLLAKKEIN
jgi:NADH-quinone oxidoreductase subunit J